MKNGIYCFAMAGLLFLLSACTVNSDAVNLYTQANPLEVEMIVPENIPLNQPLVIKLKLTQEEKAIEDAEQAEFIIWRHGKKGQQEVIQARHEKNGIYVAEKTFTADGLYYVKGDVRARSLHVMPTKQLIAGKLTKEELDLLKQEDEHQHSGQGHH